MWDYKGHFDITYPIWQMQQNRIFLKFTYDNLPVLGFGLYNMLDF